MKKSHLKTKRETNGHGKNGKTEAVPQGTDATDAREENGARAPRTIEDLGWTREEAIAIRGLFGSMAEDWDDPAMDVYDEL